MAQFYGSCGPQGKTPKTKEDALEIPERFDASTPSGPCGGDDAMGKRVLHAKQWKGALENTTALSTPPTREMRVRL